MWEDKRWIWYCLGEEAHKNTKADVDGLYEPRHESYRATGDDIHDRSDWKRTVSAAATPQPDGSSWKKSNQV